MTPGEQKYLNTRIEPVSVSTDTDRIQAVRYSLPHFPKIRYSLPLVPVLFGLNGTLPTHFGTILGTNKMVLTKSVSTDTVSVRYRYGITLTPRHDIIWIGEKEREKKLVL